jgi:hypothetical protein
VKRTYSLPIFLLCTFLISITCLTPLPIVGAQSNKNTSSIGISSYGAITYSPTPTPTPTPSSGLHVDGNKLKDANGNTVILRGVVYSTSQWWGDATSQCTEQQFIYMHDMGCNCISLSIQDYTFDKYHGADCYNDPAFWAKLDNIIAWTYAHGLYVNLRFWATSGADVNGNPSNDLGVYMSGGYGHYTWADWLNIANTISNRYKNYNHIIYEPLSEGLDIPLADYVSHMQTCIDTIRANNPNAIVNVQAAGPPPYRWETMTFNLPSVNRANVIYSWDPYAFWNLGGNDPNTIRNLAFYAGGRGPSQILAQGYPVFFSEFGAMNNADNAYDSWAATWIQNFMTVCDTDGYSGYTAWRWIVTGSPDAGTVITNWNGNLSPFGNDLKAYYLAH